jgi:hypothetical protein
MVIAHQRILHGPQHPSTITLAVAQRQPSLPKP